MSMPRNLIPDKAVAAEFGKVLVQDQKGRTKPLFTLAMIFSGK